MFRACVAALSILALSFSLGACTPRPDVADEAAENFLRALSAHEDVGGFTDMPDKANDAAQQTWDSLQAEGLDAHLNRVNTKDNVATAEYSLRWKLPAERSFAYDAKMTLTKTGKQWSVRWQPTVLHPDLGADQHLELRQVPAKQASVVGSDGAALLKPGTQWRVFLNPKRAEDVGGTLQRIGAELDAIRAEVEDTPRIDPEKQAKEAEGVKGEYSVVTVEDKVGKQLRRRLAGVQGVRLNEEAALVRPDANFAPDILSRVKPLVEKDLQGKNGWKVSAVTAEGAEVRELDVHDSVEAPVVKISLSRRVQEAAQAAVDTRPESKAMMVAIQPSTGAVLAVAQTKEADKDGDVALQGQYPPGSTFKIITAYAGMRYQQLHPDSIVGCPGSQDIGGRVVMNYDGFSLGSVPLQQAFAQSCNTTFADISSRLKPGELQQVAKMFGLGADFSIEGLDTFTGQIPRGEKLFDRTESGYGQGLNLVSPFGMALVSATAAAGHMPVPYLIQGEGHATKVTQESKSKLNPALINQLRQMMQAVTHGGTAGGMDAYGDVRGKTGEAEVNDGSHAWFTGYRGDLAFATLLVKGGGSEHATAITSEFFRHLDEDKDDPLAGQTPTPRREG